MVQQRFSNDNMNGNDFQKTLYTIHGTTKFSYVYGNMKHLLGFTTAMIWLLDMPQYIPQFTIRTKNGKIFKCGTWLFHLNLIDDDFKFSMVDVKKFPE